MPSFDAVVKSLDFIYGKYEGQDCSLPMAALALQGSGSAPNAALVNRLNKVARASLVGAYRNPRTQGVMSSPPTVSTGSLPVMSPSRDYYAVANNALTTTHPFRFGGGYPYWNPGSGGLCFPSVHEGLATGGNIDNSGRAARTWRVHFMTDAAKVSMRLLGYASPYRFLVNGQYISLTPSTTANSGGQQYLNLDFGAREPLGRKITIEGTASSAFWSAHVDMASTIWPMDSADLVKIGVIGDSICNGTGATLVNDAFSVVLGDYLGADDLWVIGIGGTGYDNVGSNFRYADHSFDWTAANGATTAATGNAQNWDLLVFTGGNNDSDSTHGPAVQQRAVDLLTATRKACPDVPIVVFGPTGIVSTWNQAVETGLAAAVVALNDPFMTFVPTQSPAVGTPEITGTGHVGAETGDGNADLYVGSDGAHPPTPGHLYLGHRRAMQVHRAVTDMLRPLSS